MHSKTVLTISDQRGEKKQISRRIFFTAAAATAAGFGGWLYGKKRDAEGDAVLAGPLEIVRIVEFTDAGVRTGSVEVPKMRKSQREWREQLSPVAYSVTREEDTEMAFSGQYWDWHEAGLFRCICCATALFSSRAKFDSGTGWPSFWESVAKENIVEKTDASFGMMRTAVSCRRCDAHLGHVFDDGPPPTGLRYCMNSVSLRFAKG
jgi:peptide-methionine (R)-S-oxide reductase